MESVKEIRINRKHRITALLITILVHAVLLWSLWYHHQGRDNLEAGEKVKSDMTYQLEIKHAGEGTACSMYSEKASRATHPTV